MRIKGAPGFVLHRYPWRESSLLVELFCREYGRLAVVARGARKNSWSLQPFVPLELGWSGRASLKTLTQAEPTATSLRLSGRNLYCGLYVNELLMRMLHQGDPHPDLYDSYASVLRELSAGDAPVEPALRCFELDALNQCGYGLPLESDMDSAPIEPDCSYDFIPGSGFRRAPDGIYSGRWLRAIRTRELADADCLRAAKGLLRKALEQALGARPLHSRELWK